MAKVAESTLKKVDEWFKEHPTGTGKQCAHDLGLGNGTISNARKMLGIAPGRKASKAPIKEKRAHSVVVSAPEAAASNPHEDERERMTLMIRPSVREKLQHMVALQGKGRGGIAEVVEELTNEAFPVWAQRFVDKYTKDKK